MRQNNSLMINDVKLELWRKRIDECVNSGVSIKQWCKDNNVGESTYYHYLKLISNKEHVANSITSVDAEEHAFVEINLLQNDSDYNDIKNQGNDVITIQSKNFSIEVSNDTNFELLRKVMVILL